MFNSVTGRLATLFVFVCVSACAASPLPAPVVSIDRQLQEILAQLPGRYVGPAPADPRDPSAAPGQVYHKIVAINAPQFGSDRVFYHQISRDGFDSERPMQQKIYAFDLAAGRVVNRMRSVVFFPGQGYANLEKDAAALQTLQPAMLMQFPDACQIRWSSDAEPGVFIARVRRTECQYQSRAFKQTIAPEMTYILSPSGFAIEDVLYGENGRPLFPATGLLQAARVPPDS